VYDVAVNSEFFKKCQNDDVFQTFIVCATIEGVAEKFKLDISAESIYYLSLSNSYHLKGSFSFNTFILKSLSQNITIRALKECIIIHFENIIPTHLIRVFCISDFTNF